MSAKCSSYMYGTPYIFHFVHPLVKTAKIMVQRVNFERNLKNIRPATVFTFRCNCKVITRFLLYIAPKKILLDIHLHLY